MKDEKPRKPIDADDEEEPVVEPELDELEIDPDEAEPNDRRRDPLRRP